MVECRGAEILRGPNYSTSTEKRIFRLTRRNSGILSKFKNRGGGGNSRARNRRGGLGLG